MTATPDPAAVQPAEPESKPPAVRLTAWLCDRVRSHDVGALADLRRMPAPTQTRLIAESFAPHESDREVFKQVAFLFARYHAGRSQPVAGAGTMGAALWRIGSPGARGPENAGASRLLDRIVSSRQIPWRHLQHAVERIRAAESYPPSWVQLTEDLATWTQRDRRTPEQWARDFYTPPRPTNGERR